MHGRAPTRFVPCGAHPLQRRTCVVQTCGAATPQRAARTRLGSHPAMSLALVQSRALLGLQAPAVTVEVHLANGLPSFTLVGLADVEVKEARERVRSALQNAGLDFPNNKRITVNLAPADLPK